MKLFVEPRKISNKVALWSWGLMAFSIPFSTFFTLLFSFFGVVFSLFTLRLNDLMKLGSSPIILFCLLLFGWLTLSVTWSVAPTGELLGGWLKYRKLLLVALIFLSLLALNACPRFLIRFFLIGCVTAATGVLFSKFNLWSMLLGPQNVGGGWGFGPSGQTPWFFIGGPDNPSFGRTYISPGLFFPAALALVGERIIYFFTNKNSAIPKNSYRVLALGVSAIFLFLAVYSLHGRTGFVLTGIVLIAMAIYVTSKYPIFLRIGVICVVVVTGLQIIPAGMAERFSRTQTDLKLQAINPGDPYLEGRRVQLWRGGIEIGMDAPLGGVGVGGFKEAFGQLGPTLNPSGTRRDHAHSEYILLFAQGGLVALLSFVSLVVISLRSGYKHQLFGLTLVLTLIFVDGFFNSVLWDLAEGHFFALIMGVTAYEIWRRERSI